jgi:lipid-A-disaccharide synthase
MSNRKIFIIAGEKSGDLHASNLIKGIKQISDNTEIYGLGGDLMQKAGCNLLYNMMDIAVVGFVEVLKHISLYKKIFHDTVDNIIKLKPDAVVLIDYPGFNLRMAKKLKKVCPDTKLVYYISPQIWAWHKSRIKDIKAVIDKMIVIFPFEVDFYKNNEFNNVCFCGHPLLDVDFFKENVVKDRFSISKIIGIFPGSRISEIKNNLDIMLKTAEDLKDFDFEIACANEKCKKEINKILEKYNLDVNLNNDAHDVMKKSVFVITASGTVTVELACAGVPMVIMYKVAFFTWLIAKMLVDIKYIGMVNILADKEISPEFIQHINPKKISEYIKGVLHDKDKYNEIEKDLSLVKSKLGESGASLRVSKEVLNII